MTSALLHDHHCVTSLLRIVISSVSVLLGITGLLISTIFALLLGVDSLPYNNRLHSLISRSSHVASIFITAIIDSLNLSFLSFSWFMA